MKLNSNKKFSPLHPRITPQELELKYLLKTENIPFTFQKEFAFPDRRYFVDFLIANKILLECASTNAFQYDIVLRQKSILLEAKISFIKQFFNYHSWVLFESKRSVGERLHATLIQLMPSVDCLFTSLLALREKLLEVLNITSKSQAMKFYSRALNHLYFPQDRLSDSNMNLKRKNDNLSRFNSFIYDISMSYVFNDRFNIKYYNYPHFKSKNNYSYSLNLKFFGLNIPIEGYQMFSAGGVTK